LIKYIEALIVNVMKSKREVFMFMVPNTALSIEMRDSNVYVYWGGNGEICHEFVMKEDGYWYDVDGDVRLGGSLVDVVDVILDLVSEMTDGDEYYESESSIRLNLLNH